jgi:hypothetical protein
MRFDYNTFYNYYTNPANQKKARSYKIYFYHNNNPKEHYTHTSNEIITIDRKNYYVKRNTGAPHSLQFTMPFYSKGKWWDNHYHFGLDPQFKNRHTGQTIPVIYFHKTVQNTTLSVPNKTHINCYFPADQDVDNLEIADCLETSSSQLGSSHKFPSTHPDFHIIQEIIRRPFYGIMFGGKRCTKKNKKMRKTRKNTTRVR